MAFAGVVPASRPVPSPYGLFSVAKVNNHGGRDEHWAGGFAYDSELCNVEGSVIDVCGGAPLVFQEPEDFTDSKVTPFGIRVMNECLSIGYSAIDWKARTIRQLELITQKGVEAELWAGAYSSTINGENQFLASDAAVDVTGGSRDTPGAAVNPKVGIALLEQAIAECGSGTQGTLHVPPAVGALFGLPEDSEIGDQLHTFNGNLVAIGTGYDGRGPGDQDPPDDWFTPWIYATGPVTVDLGPSELVSPDFGSAVNPRTNDMAFVAVRPASVFWDGCCHFAVQVDIRE